MYGYQLFSSMNSTKNSSIIIIGGWAYTTSTLLPMQELSAEEGSGLIIRHGRIIRYREFNTRRYTCILVHYFCFVQLFCKELRGCLLVK